MHLKSSQFLIFAEQHGPLGREWNWFPWKPHAATSQFISLSSLNLCETSKFELARHRITKCKAPGNGTRHRQAHHLQGRAYKSSSWSQKFWASLLRDAGGGGRLLNFSVPQFPPLQNGLIIVPTSGVAARIKWESVHKALVNNSDFKMKVQLTELTFCGYLPFPLLWH